MNWTLHRFIAWEPLFYPVVCYIDSFFLPLDGYTSNLWVNWLHSFACLQLWACSCNSLFASFVRSGPTNIVGRLVYQACKDYFCSKDFARTENLLSFERVKKR